MAFKIFVSPYTYRTEAEQLAKCHERKELVDAPVFRPEDFDIMFRPSTRKVTDTYYAASVACFARTEGAMIDFLDACRTRKLCLGDIENGFEWSPAMSTNGAIKVWKVARIRGSAHAGAKASKEKRDAETAIGCTAIKAEWPLSQKEAPTEYLLRKANKAIGKRGKMHYRTACRHLGVRPQAQWNYRLAQKRKERRNVK